MRRPTVVSFFMQAKEIGKGVTVVVDSWCPTGASGAPAVAHAAEVVKQ